MRPLAQSDVWSLEGYERHRADFRRAVIALKKARRVALGDRVTLVFENRNTLLFQVQEMLRVERLRTPEAIQQELDVYNELLPGEGELSATLFIEITDLADVRSELDRLIGLDEHLYLRIGAETIRARFDAKQMEEDRISAVQYVRFSLGEAAREGFADREVAAVLGVDHPAYAAEVELSEATRASLLEDLAGGDALLLPAPPSAASDEELFCEGGARAYRPARPRVPGHVVVEPDGPAVAFLEATPEQLAACQRAVQRAARELGARHGEVRIEGAAGPDAPLRFHLLPQGG